MDVRRAIKVICHGQEASIGASIVEEAKKLRFTYFEIVRCIRALMERERAIVALAKAKQRAIAAAAAE